VRKLKKKNADKMIMEVYLSHCSVCFLTSTSQRDIYTRILQSGSYLKSKEEDAVIINEILVRAASDPEFRNQLIRQPSNVLAQYNISDEAKSIIENSINDLTQ
jgi:hypothetical protein